MADRKVATPPYSVNGLCSGEALSDLIHKFAHEVDNPLTAIISLATILERSDLAGSQDTVSIEKHATYANAIAREAWRVSSLVERLLLIASTRSSAKEYNNVNSALFENLAKVRDRDEFDQLQVNLQICSEPLFVEMEARRLDILVTELLENAHFFASLVDAKLLNNTIPHERLSIRVTLEDHNGWLRLDVTNPVAQLYQSELNTFFKPFVTGDDNLKRAGLGLPVVVSLVERGGGRVSLEQDSDGDIANFTTSIWLPCCRGSELLAKASKTPDSSSSNATAPLAFDRDIAILVVEDEPMVSSAIAKILEISVKSSGKFSCVCVSGGEALQRVNAGDSFDCILCDLNLSGMSGRHIFEKLNEKKSPMAQRFAFLTGDSLSGETKLYLQSCSCPYLFKPFEPQQLLSLVRTMLDKQSND